MLHKPKIKIDLTGYLGTDISSDFRAYEQKISTIVTDLYSSKTDVSRMTGYLNLPYDLKMYEEIKAFTKEVLREGKYEHVLVLGIGGSSLGAQALIEGLNSPFWNRLSKGKRKGFLTIDFVDNLDPVVIRTLLSRLKLDQTLFVVISKGGNTVETIVPMLICREWVGENFYKQCVFITTYGKGLLFELSQKHSVKVFPIPGNVGGRYSVFSAVGLLVASLGGLDLEEICNGLNEADRLCQLTDLRSNLAATIALLAFFSYKSSKNIFVLMPYSTCLRRFVDWFVQLWAESLGKSQKGSTPICAIGATDQHSQLQMFNEGPNDKLICFIKINKHKRDLTIGAPLADEAVDFKLYADMKVGQLLNIELDATRRALSESKRPNFLITLPELDGFYLAQLMYILQFATSVCGYLLEVNPFDQPGVELAKRYTKEALSRVTR